MVAEPWLVKIGSHVSSNLNYACSKKSTRNRQQNQTKSPETIGILSFEVANVMSKTVRLHKSLTNSEISNLKTQILSSDGVKTLISSDETYLLDLVLSEKLEDLNFIAGVVSRLGKKCTVPHLQGFQHVYGDIVSAAIDVTELGFLVKDMDAMVRKLERFVNSTATLYGEMEVLNELEITTKKFQQNQHEESRKVFEQKLIWQIQDVRHLKNVSLWNQTYDKVVEMLARTVCTLYARIISVFSDSISRREMFSSSSVSVSSKTLNSSGSSAQNSNPMNGSCSSSLVEMKMVSFKSQIQTKKPETDIVKAEDFNFPCGLGAGRLFMECLTMNTSKLHDCSDATASVPISDDRSSHVSGSCSVSSNVKKEVAKLKGFNGNLIKTRTSIPQSKLMVKAPPNTIGGSDFALHYANIIIVIEKLLHYPHLVGDEARDDLYQMLPTSLRIVLKRNLKAFSKDLAIYDAPLAHDWKDRLDGILSWLAPMAHNMIRWQTERNFEQHHIVTRSNVLLLETLYFADREKTEAAICELLVGLNYICRYEHQQNALLDCASSFDFDDCTDWQLL